MELWEQVSRQRVLYIIESYELQGDDGGDFDDYLDELLNAYESPQIERAIVETIVASWLQLPLPKGMEFIFQTHDRLKSWEITPDLSKSALTPSQFKQITGLDPTPVFGNYHIEMAK
jgi:hypothetical protein